MQKFVLAPVFFALFFFPRIGCAQWQQLGTGQFGGPNIDTKDLAISPITGEPFVAYIDNTAPYPFPTRVNVKKYNGSSWITVGSPNFTGDHSDESVIAISTVSGEPYVAYMDSDSGSSKMNVMRFNGNNWVLVGNARFTPSNGFGTSIGFSSTGELFVSLTIVNTGIQVYKFDGLNWASVGYPGIPGSLRSNDGKMKINPKTNEPHVMYTDNNDSGKLYIYRFTNTNWSKVGAAFPEKEIGDQQFAFDSLLNKIYVTYYNRNSSGYMTFYCRVLNGINWDIVGYPLVSSSDNFGSFDQSLAINPDTHEPYIAYSDVGIQLGKWDGYNWVKLGLQTQQNEKPKLVFHPISHLPYVIAEHWFCSVYKFDNCTVTSSQNVTACNIYERPENRGYYTSSGIYLDTVRGMNNCDSIATINLAIIPVDTSVSRAPSLWTANQSGAIYQWYNCHSHLPIAGATNQSYAVPYGTSYAPYSVRITLNGCTVESKCVPQPVGVKQLNARSAINIYPNPTEGQIMVRTENNPVYSVEVFDLSGKRICEYRETEILKPLTIPGSPGIYLLKIQLFSGDIQWMKLQKE